MGIAALAMMIAVIPIGALAVGGVYLIVRGLRDGRPYPSCGSRECGYDLSGSIGHTDRCPECGAAFADVGIRPPGRGRNVGMTLTGVAMVLAPAILGGAIVSILVARQEAAMARQQAAIQIMPLPNVQPVRPAPQQSEQSTELPGRVEVGDAREPEAADEPDTPE